MGEHGIALFLVDETNEFQRLLRTDAERAARNAGLTIETRYSGIDVATQLSMLQWALDGERRPQAIMVMCVHDRGLQRIVRRAAQAGVHVVLLNAVEDDLDSIRGDNPTTAITTVCPDEIETGRIQGRQFQQLVPAGGRVLYAQGRVRSVAARRRTEGVLQALQGSALDLVKIEAGWTADEGRETIAAWLRVGLRANRHVDLIGCQNDMIAKGALAALEDVAAELGRPQVARIPVTGCDGSPAFGQQMVNRGELLATVNLPRATGPAVEILGRLLKKGDFPPPTVLLKPTSYPNELRLATGGSFERAIAG